MPAASPDTAAPAASPPAAPSAGSAGHDLLGTASIRHTLGAGSNGVVLLCTFPEGAPPPVAAPVEGVVPTDGRKVAIKVRPAARAGPPAGRRGPERAIRARRCAAGGAL